MTEDKNDQEPKIIVDSDWKEEARKEKEELEQEPRDMPPPGEIPEPSFVEMIQMIVLQASVGLGAVQDPQTGQRVSTNLPVAKHYIDLLEVLQTKTKGNLDDNEEALIDATLHELRMAFVQVAGIKPEQASQESKE